MLLQLQIVLLEGRLVYFANMVQMLLDVFAISGHQDIDVEIFE
jgi:hypothetical protein